MDTLETSDAAVAPAAAAAAASTEADVGEDTKVKETATLRKKYPVWRQVFLRRARIKHLLQHEWFAAVCTAHAAALEENRRLLANHASVLAVRAAAAAHGGAVSTARTGSLPTDQRLLLQATQDTVALRQQVRTIQAAAAATQRQYEKHQRHIEAELLLLQQKVQQQQQLLAEKDRDLLQQQRLLREKEEEVAEKEAQTAAARRTCLLLVQQQQQQQQAVQQAQQEAASKALEIEGYLRELLRYKQAEAASLELLQQKIHAVPPADTDSVAAFAPTVADPLGNPGTATACTRQQQLLYAEASRAAAPSRAASASSTDKEAVAGTLGAEACAAAPCSRSNNGSD
ncbi:WD-repeat protein, putative [Eimeria tenella]|uniref:WD-repeat protein, putative n=1 Tax=Eimeria tenella TaxID=5802 RepID=U6KW24_EIMTE|nr:WD-repeat protein, putative [Eimeria tenella]CDJ40544.1 WD-repeat protein, putative [Eimeria tenella]|eukprot:XP_013231294.1 WD-repeat protein, putative [Eimeria tenella]